MVTRCHGYKPLVEEYKWQRNIGCPYFGQFIHFSEKMLVVQDKWLWFDLNKKQSNYGEICLSSAWKFQTFQVTDSNHRILIQRSADLLMSSTFISALPLFFLQLCLNMYFIKREAQSLFNCIQFMCSCRYILRACTTRVNEPSISGFSRLTTRFNEETAGAVVWRDDDPLSCSQTTRQQRAPVVVAPTTTGALAQLCAASGSATQCRASRVRRPARACAEHRCHN